MQSSENRKMIRWRATDGRNRRTRAESGEVISKSRQRFFVTDGEVNMLCKVVRGEKRRKLGVEVIRTIQKLIRDM